ncbi:MAG: transglutaminaseTgpA domain-containing protein [Polyangiaceae bacterium]
MLKERLVAISIICACVPFALAAGTVALAGIVLVPALLALVIGPRFRVERSAEAMLGFAALVVGVLAPRVFPYDGDLTGEFLSDRARLLACPVLLLVSVRALLVAPTWGQRGTLALALVGLTAAGRAKIGSGYAACVIAFLLMSAIALAATDPSRALPQRSRASHALRIAGALVVGGAIAGAAGVGIPKLHAAIIDRILRGAHDRSGFSNEMTLGAMHDMLLSDQVVMRVRASGVGTPDYLRGAVFSRYYANGWHADTDELREYVQGAEAPEPGATDVSLEFVSRPERYFLPLDSSGVVASNGNYVEDRFGLRWPTTVKYAKRIWYRAAPNERLASPSREDRTVPFALRAELDRLLASWDIDPSAPPKETLERIRVALERNDAYSLDYKRTPGVDAILDFLTTHREGHCEYFAGAFALLARRMGIPTRVVAGYRVSERSPLDDYFIVRQRDAHSWVEAWVDGAWITVDATPAGAAGTRETGWLGGVFDWLRTSWEKFDDFLAARSPFELTLALVALVGLLVLIRLMRARRARRASPRARGDEALPAFERLEGALAKSGFARAPHETLEAFALRLDRSPLREASPVVRAYADHRYGGVDTSETVTAKLEEALRALASRSAAPTASRSA